jgi:hypothetical protein
MSLSKRKWWYSNNCLHFLRHVVPLSPILIMFRVLQTLTHTFYIRLTNTLAYWRHFWPRKKGFVWSTFCLLSFLCRRCVKFKPSNQTCCQRDELIIYGRNTFLFRKIDKFFEKKIFSKNDCFFRDLMPLMWSWSAGLISFGIFFL